MTDCPKLGGDGDKENGSPDEFTADNDELFSCDNSCLRACQAKDKEKQTKAKFTAPFRKTCNICGLWISNSHEWLTHHLSEHHCKAVCYLSSYRNKCIEHQDEQATAVLPDDKDQIVENIKYTQELFQMCSNSSFICTVCGSGVYDVLDHLMSLKHNESYMNVLYADDLLTLKEKSLKPTGIDLFLYESNLIAYLKERQPRTECPLDVYVLKDDCDFNDWIWKCLMALSTFTQPQEIDISLLSVMRACLPPSVNDISTTDPNELWKNDCCSICRTKLFSIDSFQKHLASEQHINKMKLFAFFQSPEKYKIIPSVSLEQVTVDKAEEPFVGAETVVELRDEADQVRIWCCLTCFVLSENTTKIFDHLSSTKHMLNYFDINYPDVKISAKSGKEMNDELKRCAREILANQERGRIRVAELTDTDVERFFELSGKKLKIPSAITNGEETTPTKQEEEELKILFSERSEEMMWCEVCYLLILVKKTEADAKEVWTKHVTSQLHITKKEARKTFVFDENNFVDEKLAPHIRDAVNKLDTVLIGLEYIIERKIKDTNGQPVHDLVCLLCAEKLHLSSFVPHVTSKQHILQYLHKSEPNLMRRILNGTDKEQNVIDDYMKKKPTRKSVRVYNPMRAELLLAEYERLKQQIAEKERLLEEKRKQKELEEKLAEQKRKEKEEEDRKIAEQRRIAELQRIEREKAEAEAKKKAEQERVLAHIKKQKERQEEEERRLMQQHRVFQKLQEERQKRREEEQKKLEQKRILDLMNKEKEKMLKEEEAKKAREKNEKSIESSNKRSKSPVKSDKAISQTQIVPKQSNKSETQTSVKPPIASSDKNTVASNDKKQANNKKEEPKWKPLAQSVAETKSPLIVKPSSHQSNQQKSDPTPQQPDVLIELLKSSSMLPIVPPDFAYVNAQLATFPEPLIGVQHVNEFECLDSAYEPGYLCRLCSCRMLTKDLLKHLASTDHRMKYLEQSYKPLFSNVVQRYMNSESRHAVIKQYAAQVERQEGRKRIELRLTMKVSDKVLNTKKMHQQPNFSIPPPSIHGPLLTTMPAQPDIYPPGTAPPKPRYAPTPLLYGVPGFNPLARPPLLPPLSSTVPVVSPLLRSPVVSANKSTPTKPQPISSTSTALNSEWDDKCAQFLQKLTSNKQDESGEKRKPGGGAASESKPDGGGKASGTSSTADRKRSRSRSRSRSRKRSHSRSRPDRPRQGGDSGKRRKSSRSRSPSRHRSDRNASHSMKQKDGTVTETTKKLSGSSVKPEFQSPIQNKASSSTIAAAPIGQDPLLTADDLSVLQNLAVSNPAALEELLFANPQILNALLNSDVTKAPEAISSSASATAQSTKDQQSRREPQTITVPVQQSGGYVAQHQHMSTVGIGGETVNKTAGIIPQPPAAVSSSTKMRSPEDILMQLLSEEEEKKRRQVEQEKLLYNLLKQVSEVTSGTAAAASSSNSSSAYSKQVYDYSHGQNKKDSSSLGNLERKTAEIDSLVNEASFNVQQAQRGDPAPGLTPFSSYNMPPPAIGGSNFGMFRERPAVNTTDLKATLEMQLEHRRQEQAKEIERKRKEALDNLAKELCAPAADFLGGSLGGGRTNVDPMKDIEKILGLAKAQSQISQQQLGGAAVRLQQQTIGGAPRPSLAQRIFPPNPPTNQRPPIPAQPDFASLISGRMPASNPFFFSYDGR